VEKLAISVRKEPSRTSSNVGSVKVINARLCAGSALADRESRVGPWDIRTVLRNYLSLTLPSGSGSNYIGSIFTRWLKCGSFASYENVGCQ